MARRWSAWHEHDEHEKRPVRFYVQVSRTNAQVWIGRHIFRLVHHEPKIKQETPTQAPS